MSEQTEVIQEVVLPEVSRGGSRVAPTSQDGELCDNS